MKLNEISLMITATLTALMAGLLFSYSISVNLGLGKLADLEYIKAMQSINKEIQNPVFFVCFFGALVLLPLSTFMNDQKPVFLLLLCATISYVAGVIGITVFGNVPLNNQLAQFNVLTESLENIKQQRIHFEQNWNFFHSIRTAFALISTVLVICACILHKPAA